MTDCARGRAAGVREAPRQEIAVMVLRRCRGRYLATRVAREIGRGLVQVRCPGAKEVEHDGKNARGGRFARRFAARVLEIKRINRAGA
jgi:hypothetical protein